MQEDWQPLVSWIYQNSEWSEMLRHRKDHGDAQHAHSARRVRFCIAAFVAVGLLLFCVSTFVFDDALSGVVLGVVVAGLGAGLLHWHFTGEQKWARLASQRMQAWAEQDTTAGVEIGLQGVKFGEHFVLWKGDRRLRSVSLVSEPMKALKFEYDFLSDEHFSREFMWIPIPPGREREAEALARTINL